MGYAVAFVDLDIVGGIQVDEDNLEFSSVVGVNEARRVDYRQALLDGQAAAGLDEAGVAIGQGNGQPSRDQTAFEGPFGAFVSYFFISRCFGLSAFIVPVFMGMAGLKLVRAYNFNLIKMCIRDSSTTLPSRPFS